MPCLIRNPWSFTEWWQHHLWDTGVHSRNWKEIIRKFIQPNWGCPDLADPYAGQDRPYQWNVYDHTTGTGGENNLLDLIPPSNASKGGVGSINNFRLNCRPEFPARTYKTSSLYTTNHALPSESYYAIKDLATNEYVVEFDNDFTQISCDATGSYFKVYMNGLEPERNYKILVKTNIAGNTIVLDEDYYFKVVNG